MKIPVSSASHQQLGGSNFFHPCPANNMWDILLCETYYVVVLICVSLIVCEIEHFSYEYLLREVFLLNHLFLPLSTFLLDYR